MNHANQTIINQLNNLLSIIEVSKEAYQHAALKISDPTLREEFHIFYQERLEYSVQLQQEILKHNGIPVKDVSKIEQINDIRAEIRSSINPSERFTLMNICVSVEEIAIEEYRELIDNPDVPSKLKEVLSQQLNGIEHTFLFLVAQFV